MGSSKGVMWGKSTVVHRSVVCPSFTSRVFTEKDRMRGVHQSFLSLRSIRGTEPTEETVRKIHRTSLKVQHRTGDIYRRESSREVWSKDHSWWLHCRVIWKDDRVLGSSMRETSPDLESGPFPTWEGTREIESRSTPPTRDIVDEDK